METNEKEVKGRNINEDIAFTECDAVPENENEAIATINGARKDSHRLLCIGSGQSLKRMHRRYDRLVSSRALDQLVFYEPDETVIRIGAGMRLRTLQALLQSHNQLLPFDPPDLADNSGAGGTIGGVVAMALSGPESYARGRVRDHVLGCRFINGRGEIIRAGSRVIKNVTGYDITKLFCGCWGQLGLMTEVTLRTSVQPSTTMTFSFPTCIRKGMDIIIRLIGSPYAPVATTWVDSAGAHALGLGKLPRLILRFSGLGHQTRHATSIARAMASELSDGSPRLANHKDADERLLWQTIRNLSLYRQLPDDTALWKITLPGDQTANVVEAMQSDNSNIMVDGAGSRFWMTTHDNHEHVRSKLDTLTDGQGRAFLFCHPKTMHQADEAIIPSQHPPTPAFASLERRIIQAFDPSGVFSLLT